MLQALNQEKKALKDVEQASLSKKKVEVHTQMIEYGSQSVFSFMVNVVFIIIVILVSAPKIIAGTLTVGILIVFIQYIYQLVWPLMQISENVMQIQRSLHLEKDSGINKLPTEDELYTELCILFLNRNPF